MLQVFVGQQPSTGKETQTRAEEVMAKRKEQLTDTAFMQAQTNGARVPIEAVWQMVLTGG